MKNILKKILVGLLVLAVIFVGLHFFARYKVGKLLDGIDKENFSYKEYSINLFQGDLSVKDISYRPKKQNLQAKTVSIRNFNYLSYLVLGDSIVVEKLQIENPNLQLSKKNDSSVNGKKSNKFSEKIRVNTLEINNGRLSYRTDSVKKFEVPKINLKIKNIKTGPNQIKQKIPFQYGDYFLEADSLNFVANAYQDLSVARVEISEEEVLLQKLRFLPTKNRKDYVNYIPYEKDLMTLKLDSIHIPSYKFSYKEETPHFSAGLLSLSEIDFSIYRDKTVKDDPRKKDMYSTMIRNLPIQLKIDSVALNKAEIKYEEKIKEDRNPGKVNFKNLNAKIYNLTNIDLDRKDFPTTKLQINTSFFGKSPLEMQWQFKVNDTTGRFRFRGNVLNVPPSSMNEFFIPAMNVKAKGSMQAVYYDFEGNRNTAHGKTKLVYDNFDLAVLKEDSKSESGILSFLANIIVNKSPKNGSITSQVESVKRDKTKSFWNYFWSCLEAGIKKSLL